VVKDGKHPVDAGLTRVAKAVRRLRELETSGAEIHEILGGGAGIVFVRDDCDGDLDIAYVAFALVHAPTARGAYEIAEIENTSGN
jgi:hypothetical protein